eukprot:scaffold3171_cov380-Prasinococcus_capsulatus_cf.AAC.1
MTTMMMSLLRAGPRRRLAGWVRAWQACARLSTTASASASVHPLHLLWRGVLDRSALTHAAQRRMRGVPRKTEARGFLAQFAARRRSGGGEMKRQSERQKAGCTFWCVASCAPRASERVRNEGCLKLARCTLLPLRWGAGNGYRQSCSPETQLRSPSRSPRAEPSDGLQARTKCSPEYLSRSESGCSAHKSTVFA